MMTRTWRIYGAEGHRMKESFNSSKRYDFSVGDVKRIIEVENSDKTGTNEYTIVSITADSPEECEAELNGQLSDGIFENMKAGEIEEVATYIVRDREAGNHIGYFWSYEAAEDALREYEADDMEDGTYTPDFYEIAKFVGGIYTAKFGEE